MSITTQDEVRFTMRMEAGLYEQLKERAERNKRSIAKELEFITECVINSESRKLKRFYELTKLSSTQKLSANEQEEHLSLFFKLFPDAIVELEKTIGRHN